MNKSRLLVLCFFAPVLFCISGCTNIYIEELLRDSARLENLGVLATDGNIYSSQPEFHPDQLEYSVRVPYHTTDIQILARAHADGKARFTVQDETNANGKFLFDKEEARALINVEQPYMDSRTYTLRIRRGADSTLWDIQFRQHVSTGGHTEELPLNTISPGYTADRYGKSPNDDYTLFVQANVSRITLRPQLRPDAKAEFLLDTSPGGSHNHLLGPYPSFDHSAVYSLSCDPADNPDTFEKTYNVVVNTPTVFYIKVWRNSDPDATAELYKINVQWPHPVEYDASGWSPSSGTAFTSAEVHMNGLLINNTYFFNAGDPVSFALKAPFGTYTSKVEWLSGETWVNLEPNSLDLYSFVMPPTGSVKIRAAWEEVAAPAGGRVRFARPGGTGDGSNWYNAGNLNTLIDDYTGASPNDYEIWLAAGTYNPPGAAGDFNRSFILKDGIKIYGGFTGKEQSPGGRKYADEEKTRLAEQTELSGNYPNGDRVFHTVIAAGIDTAELDGLVIQGATNSSWPGTSCIVNGNSIKSNYGGAFYVMNSNPVLKNVTIQGGLSPNAAGLYVTSTGTNASRPVFLHCRFTNNQSAYRGSAIGIEPEGTGSSHLLMIGGVMDINFDADGVLFIGSIQKATLINVSIVNNKEIAVNHYKAAMIPDQPPTAGIEIDADFIHCSISGNRSNNEGLPKNVVSIGTYYNSIIQDNSPQFSAPDKTALNLKNTYAPEHTASLPGISSGIPKYYPLSSAGTWNPDCPIINTFTGTGTSDFGSHPFAGLENLLIEALKRDGNGKPRFSGTAIKLGAVQ